MALVRRRRRPGASSPRRSALLLSGTHLSQPQHATTPAARRCALARAAGTRVVLDIDYRPVLWGLTAPASASSATSPPTQVSAHAADACCRCATWSSAPRRRSTSPAAAPTRLAALRRLRELTRGDAGRDEARADGLRRLRRRDSRRHRGRRSQGPGFPVEVFNVLGAGDAFMAGFLRGWLRGRAAGRRCCAYANACGALVVSRHGCAPAMPSWTELQPLPRPRLADAAPARGRRARAPAPRHHPHAPTGRSWRCSPSTTASSSRSSPRAGADAAARIARFKHLRRRRRAPRRRAARAAPAAPPRSA